MIIRPLFGGFVVIIFVAACVFCNEGIPELYFTTEPSSVTAQQGESVLLDCAASGEQPINITWRQGSEQLLNQTGAVEMWANGSLWVHLSEETAGSEPESRGGMYQCCATNARGTICSPEVSVVANVPPSKPIVLPQELEVVQNGSARLRCEAGRPYLHPFLWQKDEQDLAEDSRYTLLPDGVLQITPVVPEDTGEYHCITTEVPTPLSTSEPAQLTVLAELDGDSSNDTASGRADEIILKGPEDVTRNVPSGVVVLECLAAGSWVSIEWSRTDGRELPSGKSHFVGHKNLELTDLTTDDDGEYSCEATDTITGEVSRASAVVRITAFYPPQFTEQPENYNANHFATARLFCAATGNPQPTITWYQNGKLRMVSQHVESKSDSSDLVIWNVESTDEGIYQCFASNSLGTIQSSALLTVKLPENRPDPPYNLTVLTISSNSILVRWQAPKDVRIFSVHHYIEPDGEETQNVLANEHTNTYLVSNLQPYTNYTFYMRAYTTAASAASERVVGHTAEGVPTVTPKFSLTSSAASTIIVHWERITDPVISKGQIVVYRICYQESGQPREYMCREVSGSEDNFTIRGLKPVTVYDVHMAASTSMGFGPESEIQTIRTTNSGNCSVPLMFPLDDVIVLNDTEVKLTWSGQGINSSVPVQGFRLHLSGVTEGDGIDLSPDTYSYVFSDLLPDSSYTFRLVAYNKCGQGPACTQTITMPSVEAEGYYYPPPKNVRATSLSSTSIQLNWNPVLSLSRHYYKIIYRQNSNTWTEETKEIYRTSTYVVLEDLKPFTIYTLQVRVHQTGVIGQYSPEVYCRTKEDVPSAPVDFSAKPLDPHTVSVAWCPPLNPNGVIKAYNIMYVPDKETENGQNEPPWNTTRKKGTETSSTIRNLTSGTRYYFVVRARTSVGEGKPSTVVEVRTPTETNFHQMGPDTGGKPGQPSDIEKGLFIGVILGSICILLCTFMAVIRYKKYHALHKQKMARLAACQGRRVPVSRLARGGGVEMEMNVLSPMLAAREQQDLRRLPNAQIHCESPLLGFGHCRLTDQTDRSELPLGYLPVAGDGQEVAEPPTNSEQQDHQQYRHTLPSMSNSRAPTSMTRHAAPTCSASLPDSGSEDGAAQTPLRESTSGDSGLIGDMEFPMEETSPDFIEKILQGYHIGSHPI